MSQDTPIYTLTLPTDLTLLQLPELQRHFLADLSLQVSEFNLMLLYGTQVDSAGLQFLLWLHQKGPTKLTVIVPPQHSLLTLLELYQLTPPFKVQITG